MATPEHLVDKLLVHSGRETASVWQRLYEAEEERGRCLRAERDALLERIEKLEAHLSWVLTR